MSDASTPAPPDDAAAAPSEPAQVQVVRGEPDDVELAALVAGLVAVSGASSDDDDAPRPSAWSDRSRALRSLAAPPPGPDAWRWSLHR